MPDDPLTPQDCLHCGEACLPGDMIHRVPAIERDGRASIATSHHECYLRSIVGGLNHLMGRCSCCGGTEPPDPPGLTRREAVLAAVRYWEKHPLLHTVRC